ncbi:Uncharacterised protein [Staphylococcus aureus]|nr:hypothetical protein [Staphylococcus aureus]SAZ06514.1 Uncharacterised protein [Staphylococcus aureus]
MDNHNQCNYVNPQNVSLDWECFIISKSEMLLDGVPNELINTWLDKDIITPFSIRNDEINFKNQNHPCERVVCSAAISLPYWPALKGH